eukprot:gnl/Dysnectes_brevis/1712_a1947_1149.p1 GENE.gnl/Dysnectes_brevis/1712_a1947_1149~~gnl/Dysnectes_brevis/1712_a1947_1149.p1  ORF type:complete len:1244 (-),score=323.32 gnl/Dysnectes_brevis/1712_a1947_1149:40-3771(-)
MLIKFKTKSDRVKSTAFHPKRPLILIALHTGSIELWNYVLGTLVDTFEGHKSPVRCVHFHPTQPLFVSGGDDGTVRLWDLTDRKLLHIFTGHTDYVRTVFFHPTTQPWILSASDDATARIWNWQSRTRVADLVGHREFVMCAKWHPTEELVATASLDGTIRVWDTASLRGKHATGLQQLAVDLLTLPLAVIANSVVGQGHSRGVNWVSWHPDDAQLLASASDDHTVKVWRLSGARSRDAMLYSVATLGGHSGHVSAVEFTTRNSIISNSLDGSIRFYEAKSRVFIDKFSFKEGNETRWWSISEHPSLNLYAAGHDKGCVVFTPQRERPAFSVGTGKTNNNNVFYVARHKLHRVGLDGSSSQVLAALKKQTAGTGSFGADRMVIDPVDMVVSSGKDAPFPLILNYYDGVNHFCDVMTSATTVRRRVQMPAPVVPVSRATWGCLTSIAPKDKRAPQGGMFIQTSFFGAGRGLTNGALVPLSSGARHLLPAPRPGHVLVSYPDRVELIDTTDASIDSPPTVIASLALPSPVKRAAWSPNGAYVALMSSHSVHVANGRTLRRLAYARQHSRVKGGVWTALTGSKAVCRASDRQSVFVFATLTHVRYCLTNGHVGTFTSLNRPIYPLAFRGSTLHFIDRQERVQTLQFDTVTAALFSALLDGRKADAAALLPRVRKAKLGASALAYLVKQGHPAMAMPLVDEPSAKFRLGLKAGLVEEALAAADGFEASPDDLLELSSTALKQGQVTLAMDTAHRAGRPDRAAFIAAVSGITPTPTPTSKVSQKCDPSVALNLSLLSQDPLTRARALITAGLHSLAHAVAVGAGLDDVVTEIEEMEVLHVNHRTQDSIKPLSSPTALAAASAEGSEALRTGSGMTLGDWPRRRMVAAPTVAAPSPTGGEEASGDWESTEEEEEEHGRTAGRVRSDSTRRHDDEGSDEEGSGWEDSSSDVSDSQEGASGSDAKKQGKDKDVESYRPPSRGPAPERPPTLWASVMAGEVPDLSSLKDDRGVKAAGAAAQLRPELQRLRAAGWSPRPLLPGVWTGVWGGDTPLVTIETLETESAVALGLVTKGSFRKARSLLRECLTRTVLVPERAGRATRERAAVYVAALDLELARKRLDKSDVARSLELSVLFTSAPLTASHRLLAGKAALSRLGKHGAVDAARELGSSLLAIPGADAALLADVESRLHRLKRKTNSFEGDLPVGKPACATTHHPLHTKGALSCSYCQIKHSSSCKGSDCGVCGLGMIE